MTKPELSGTKEINAYYDRLKKEASDQFEDALQDLQLGLYQRVLKIDIERETVLKAATESNGQGVGCRIMFQDNTLYCARHDNFLENLATAKRALEMLLGFEVEADQLTVEQYRSIG